MPDISRIPREHEIATSFDPAKDFIIIDQNGYTKFIRRNLVDIAPNEASGTLATTVVSERSLNNAPAQVGVSVNAAREDHSHGTPQAPTASSLGAEPILKTVTNLGIRNGEVTLDFTTNRDIIIFLDGSVNFSVIAGNIGSNFKVLRVAVQRSSNVFASWIFPTGSSVKSADLKLRSYISGSSITDIFEFLQYGSTLSLVSQTYNAVNHELEADPHEQYIST